MSDDDGGRMGSDRHTSLDAVLNIGPPTPPISNTPSNAETPSPSNGHPLPRTFSNAASPSNGHPLPRTFSNAETPSPSNRHPLPRTFSNAETPSPSNGHPLPRTFSRSNSASSRRRSSSSRRRGDDERKDRRGSTDDREHRISETEIRELTTLLSYLHKDVTTLITRLNLARLCFACNPPDSFTNVKKG
eukprot:sb/3471202/